MEQQAAGQEQRHERPSVSPAATADPFAELDLKQLGASLGQRVRVRQHVNPLKTSLQTPPEPPQWERIFRDPQLPLVIDIGAGSGRFLLSYSRRMPELNMLGLEIREPVCSCACYHTSIDIHINTRHTSIDINTSVLDIELGSVLSTSHSYVCIEH